MTNSAPPRVPRWIPVTIVVLAVLALAVTVRSRDSFWPQEATGVLSGVKPIVAIGVLFPLLGLFSLVGRYRYGNDGLLVRAAWSGAVLIIAATVATPIAVIALHRASSQPPETAVPPASQPPPATVTPTPSATVTPKPTHPVSHDSTMLVTAIIAAFAIAVVIALVIIVIRIARARERGFGRLPAAAPRFGTIDDAEDLAEAVEAATAALADGEAREAVIACYAAMEDRMRAAGLGRQDSDSPEELLIRAARVGFVRGDAGRRLTDLFREARFSTHPVSEGQRAAARDALLEIAEDLRQAMAEKTAQAARAVELAAGRNAEAVRAAAEARTLVDGARRGTHR